MKTYFMIIGFLFAFVYGSAQNDTLQQQNILKQNVNTYIGKPFSFLYNDINLKPKSVSGFIASKNKYIEWAHKFYYEVADSISEDRYIYIEWAQPPLKTATLKFQNAGLRNFNSQEYPTYQDLIITKLEIYPQ